jgi:class 3 adenylate cyclase
MGIPPTRYATTPGGLSIAYQVVSDTGPNLIWVTGTASHIELFWELPGWAHLIRRLAAISRLVWFDKRGSGLSDRDIGSMSFEARAEDIGVVMDAAGMDSAIVIGGSEGAAMAAFFAARFPERVDRLVLFGGIAHAFDNEDFQLFPEVLMESWGTGILLEAIWAQGISDTDLLARIERAMGTPTSMAALVRANSTFDVRPALPLIQAPTLVIHATDDPILSVEGSREMARLIPGARLMEIDGTFHASGRPADMDKYGTLMEEFITGSVSSGSGMERVLSTVLFTDIVDSTNRASLEGDRRWAELLDDHDQICQRAVNAGRGRVVKMTGDGVLATFDGPAAAISAAQSMIANVAVLGLHLRAGVHTGEIERRGSDIGGVGVNFAARVMAASQPDQVWVSATVPGLSSGSGISFTSCGQHTLKGIDGAHELHAVTR